MWGISGGNCPRSLLRTISLGKFFSGKCPRQEFSVCGMSESEMLGEFFSDGNFRRTFFDAECSGGRWGE